MTVLDVLYMTLIMPLQLFFEVLYYFTNGIIDNPGLSIVALSLMMNFLVLPLYMRADAMQEYERIMEEKLRDGVAHIKKTFKGDEKTMMLQTYYRQNDYKPTDVFKGSISLFLEIPFFIAAYMFLSHLQLIQGVQFWFISDLGSPDALIHFGDFSINVLPFVMTAINLVSCVIFVKGMPRKTQIQLYGMAVFFLIFLYNSPAGLVFYWTLNNVFALVKTIFYKLKNPKKVLIILFAIAGIILLVFGSFIYNNPSWKKTLLIVGMGIAFLCPLVIAVVRERISFGIKLRIPVPNKKVFLLGSLLLTVLLGVLIPSAVIGASPQEFISVQQSYNPLWYIANSACLAIGFFLVWFNVFYWLCNDKAKTIFSGIVWILCCTAIVDYMFFGNNLGIITSTLQFENGLSFERSEKLINAVLLVCVAVVVLFVFIRFNKAVSGFLAISVLAIGVMSGMNIASIQTNIQEKLSGGSTVNSATASFTLSKEGKNVVVIMMDRAMNEYVPYIMNEKPELKEIFSGFTYYDNVISYGGYTNVGTPPLYGGYEYTPEKMNSRSDESLASKQNEALRVMPVIFEEEGYNVTVCDPTYAGYQWIPDLSIYDDYPDIKTYITMGSFMESPVSIIENNNRNFFFYSLMKTSPVVFQSTFYNGGNYNSTKSTDQSYSGQIVEPGGLEASGLTAGFMDSYAVLQNLTNMTTIEDSDSNNFLMMSNDTTHEVMILQEPDYIPQSHIDNGDIEPQASKNNVVNGVALDLTTDHQKQHYHSNMAAFIQLGNWIEYLKENDVYDNTRIIIVSDHAANTDLYPEMLYGEGTENETYLDYFYPLLMMKDFGATEFTISSAFMTNADVPTMAFSNLIENPVNPATGNIISGAGKDGEQHVYFSREWDTLTNNGNTFQTGGVWFSVRDDMREIENWTCLNE